MKYTETEMLEFADWCRHGPIDLECSNLHDTKKLLKEWESRKFNHAFLLLEKSLKENKGRIYVKSDLSNMPSSPEITKAILANSTPMITLKSN